MKIKLNAPIRDLKGEQLISTEKVPITFKEVLVDSLFANSELNNSANDNDKLSRYQLARKIMEAEDEVVISSAEITLLRTLIAASFNVLVSGQSIELLENGGEREGEDEPVHLVIAPTEIATES